MKLCTVTGSRAEFFILKNLIAKFQKEQFFKHSLLITGSHTSKFFGKTIRDIKREGINIKRIINLNLRGDKPQDISNYFATGVKKFSKEFLKLKPDLVLVLGDRYEYILLPYRHIFLIYQLFIFTEGKPQRFIR